MSDTDITCSLSLADLVLKLHPENLDIWDDLCPIITVQFYITHYIISGMIRLIEVERNYHWEKISLSVYISEKEMSDDLIFLLLVNIVLNYRLLYIRIYTLIFDFPCISLLQRSISYKFIFCMVSVLTIQ